MEVLMWSVIIFFARVTDVALGTLRVQLIVRRKKVLAAAIGFVEVLIFIMIVSRVIQDIQHLPYVLAYAGGFATGTLLGIYLSEKLTHRVVQTTIMCNGSQFEMEVALREAGFALTRYEGTGRDGAIAVLDVVCAARRLPQLLDVIRKTDPKAFFYTQELAGLHGGYVMGLKSKL